ncbi:MAG: response regulator [Victivallis sp.]
MKILLLEDDPQTAAFIRKGLEQAGFTVAHSGDGLAGLVMAQEEEFDLAVVDVMLPRLDGFGVVRKARRPSRTSRSSSSARAMRSRTG